MTSGLPDENRIAPSRTGDLFVRTLSTLILIPSSLVVVYSGGVVYAFACAILCSVVFVEWCRITDSDSQPWLMWAGGITVFLTVFLAGTSGAPISLYVWAAGAMLAVVAWVTGRVTSWPFMGVVYVGAAGFGLVLLREGETGLVTLLFLLAIVWGTDIFAYLVGRMVGGPKLWPAVSPAKTWAGAVGGLVGGTLAGLGLLQAVGTAIDARIITIAVLLSVGTQAGDLFESALKRSFSVKDSGNLIPGHGGMFDRLDGLLLAAIIALFAGLFQSGLSHPAHGLILGIPA